MTTIFNNDLWLKIDSFQMDQANVYEPFSKRLAREQQWTPEFTEKAIEEYKKFMFLAATSDFSVTPSLVIDEVWHTHLTFTKSYWTDFCKNILNKDIHHTPSGGSDEETLRYHDAFLKTVEAYKMVFEMEAPKEIWFSDPKLNLKNEENKEKRTASRWTTFALASFTGLMFSSFFPFIIMMLLGNILSAAIFPLEPNPFDEKNGDGGDGGGGCSGGGCSGGSCGGGCGGCGGCGGG